MRFPVEEVEVFLYVKLDLAVDEDSCSIITREGLDEPSLYLLIEGLRIAPPDLVLYIEADLTKLSKRALYLLRFKQIGYFI